MRQRIRTLIALLCAVALLVAVTPPAAVAANWPPMAQEDAIALLRFYDIVRGDPQGNLLLDQRLTRAQAATIFVRAMGRESYAQMLRDVVAFEDARGHWAAGEIAMAERLGLMKGYGGGEFGPNREITYAEVLTVLLRMVGQEPAGPWSPERIMAAAADLNLVPSYLDGRDPAQRGQVFWSMAIAISQVELASGRTLLQEYIDTEPPSLSLSRMAEETEATYITVEGTARDAYRVTVNGEEVALQRSSGRFTVRVNLEVGANEIVVEAFDYAGNKATETVTVSRRAQVGRIQIEGPTYVRAGSNVKLDVQVTDRYGNPAPTDDLEYELTGDVATFDLRTFTLRVGTETGRGVLTISSGRIRDTYSFTVTAPSDRVARMEVDQINRGRAPGIDQEVEVTVRMLDESGRLVTDDYWRSVTLMADGLNGVSIEPRTATTEAGVATFTIKATRETRGELVFRSSGLDEVAVPIEFLTSPRIVLSANVKSLMPDGSSTTYITATLEDENGRRITNNTDSDIIIDLQASGTDGTLSGDSLVIRRGRYNSSGTSVTFQAGYRQGTATITGTVISDHDYSIQTLSIPVTANTDGLKLRVVGPSTAQEPGSTATVTVQVVDSRNRVVTTGSYAFQLVVRTSNNDEIISGLPEGVQLNFAGSVYRPVDDGRSDSDPLNDAYAVVGRTYRGTATLELRYDRSGTVTITPKAVGGTDWAYNDDTDFGPATGSAGMQVEPAEVLFAGTPSQVRLTVDSMIGSGEPGGATTSGRSVTLRAQVVDDQGMPIPNWDGTIVLTRESGTGATRISGSQSTVISRTAVNGVAEFTVVAIDSAGYDRYSATAGSLTSDPVTVAVRDARAEQPFITAVRGFREGSLSPVNGYVAPDDDYMEIQLEPMVSPNAGEPDYWVQVKVYRQGERSPFYTDVIDISGFAPMVRIPKASLRAGEYTYEVVINNGAGDSSRSPDTPLARAINAVYNTGYQITSAKYDAATGTLTLYTRGLSTSGAIDPALLSIVKGDAELSLGDPTVTIESTRSSTWTIQLGDLAAQVDPDLFHGNVVVKAEDGWYMTADSANIAKGMTAPLTPMAVITHAVLDSAAKRLYLYGDGFRHGTLSVGLIAIHDGTASVTLNASYDKVIGTSDTQVIISLSQATLDAINALSGQTGYVTAQLGWLKSSNFAVGPVEGTAHGLYVQAYIRSAAYDRNTNTLTLYGSGYQDATVDPTKLRFAYSGMTGAEWRPSAGTQVTVEDDAVIRITFTDTDAAQFESTFGGRRVYLNGDAGWLTNASQWPAAPLPANYVTFTVSN